MQGGWSNYLINIFTSGDNFGACFALTDHLPEWRMMALTSRIERELCRASTVGCRLAAKKEEGRIKKGKRRRKKRRKNGA